MSGDYRIVPSGEHFIVIDPLGEQLADVSQPVEIERCKKEDAIYDSAKELVDSAVEAHMKKFGVDRETSSCWIRSATVRNRPEMTRLGALAVLAFGFATIGACFSG